MEQLIRNLYRVFSKYEKPSDFRACKHCMSDEEKAVLLNGWLRELEPDELAGYAGKVFLTVGGLDDFKYFLPRILQLSVNEEFFMPCPEVVFGSLRMAEWEQWPEDERAAILELINCKFDLLLQNPESKGSDLDEWICAFGQCVPDITPYLNRLFEKANEDKLLSFIEWNPSVFTMNKLDNAFWLLTSINEERVLAWMKQERIKALLSERYGMSF